jgi:cobalamin biosynthesis protein CobD/CbiB
MPVYYEQLALHPREWMTKIVTFLDLPWNDTVLHHQDFIGDKISLSRSVHLSNLMTYMYLISEIIIEYLKCGGAQLLSANPQKA